jgi:formylglycine-generating enzyme required for sulfatase activity
MSEAGQSMGNANRYERKSMGPWIVWVGVLVLTLFGGTVALVRCVRSGLTIQTRRLKSVPTNRLEASVRATQPRDADLILIPAGIVQIGDDAGPPDELPAFDYTSRVFLMDPTPVTVAQFAAFVKDTGYKTDAERFGCGGVLDQRQRPWVAVKGAV